MSSTKGKFSVTVRDLDTNRESTFVMNSTNDVDKILYKIRQALADILHLKLEDKQRD